MFDFLKNHPFPVAARFESSIVLTFAFPKSELEGRIPPCLSLDTFQDEWAFVAVAMVQTKDLRPKGFPAFMGNDFFLIGYRIFVKYHNRAGKRWRGLYILQSETDSQLMSKMGNIFTHYNYQYTDINTLQNGHTQSIHSQKSGFQVAMDMTADEVALPSGSPFPDWATARRYAGPLPFTFSYLKDKKEVLIIEGVREDWTPKPLKITDYQFSFFEKMGLQNPILANAFIIKDIPYYWKKGIIEAWTP